jgi:hypothetical protein
MTTPSRGIIMPGSGMNNFFKPLCDNFYEIPSVQANVHIGKTSSEGRDAMCLWKLHKSREHKVMVQWE